MNFKKKQRKTHRAHKVSNIPQAFKRKFNVNFTCTAMRRHQLSILFTKRRLQAMKAPTKVWWDIENQRIPANMEEEYIVQVGHRIIQEIRNLGYVGDVEIRAIGSVDRKLSERVKRCLHNPRSGVKLSFVGEEGLEVADAEIMKEMRAWLKETIKSGVPGNVLLIVGDKGYLALVEQTVRSGSNFFLSYDPLNGSPILKAMAKHFWSLRPLIGAPEERAEKPKWPKRNKTSRRKPMQ
ncbi:hypothetical protein ARALYDRAFT_904330 [Arabidopsis lyrata subsp. lyrata]|uniref:NYN domain-containing protein n=2 Tax=Arabidopsis lyrata subsp. lyrata TaxID=81972 RepID=D7LLQ6_ARALL|nr:hypothetical protein ARALYDRAFT_904330 [Arabidopsis lyrata subsp. lyrata]